MISYGMLKYCGFEMLRELVCFLYGVAIFLVWESNDFFGVCFSGQVMVVGWGCLLGMVVQ